MPLINVNNNNFDLDAFPCVDQENPNNNEFFTYNREWLLSRFEEGMVIKKLDTPNTAFIEYMPAETSWKPIFAPGYILIHHVFVAEDYPDQRLKSELIDYCETENSEKNGIVIVLEDKDFLQEQDFYLNRGYIKNGHLPGFTLLVKKFQVQADDPVFALSLNDENQPSRFNGITITFADQSDFLKYYIYQMKTVFEDMGFEVQLRKLKNAAEAQESGSPYGTFGVFLNGNFLTHKLMNREEIEELIGSLDVEKMHSEAIHSFDAITNQKTADFAYYG